MLKSTLAHPVEFWPGRKGSSWTPPVSVATLAGLHCCGAGLCLTLMAPLEGWRELWPVPCAAPATLLALSTLPWTMRCRGRCQPSTRLPGGAPACFSLRLFWASSGLPVPASRPTVASSLPVLPCRSPCLGPQVPRAPTSSPLPLFHPGVNPQPAWVPLPCLICPPSLPKRRRAAFLPAPYMDCGGCSWLSQPPLSLEVMADPSFLPTPSRPSCAHLPWTPLRSSPWSRDTGVAC